MELGCSGGEECCCFVVMVGFGGFFCWFRGLFGFFFLVLRWFVSPVEAGWVCGLGITLRALRCWLLLLWGDVSPERL